MAAAISLTRQEYLDSHYRLITAVNEIAAPLTLEQLTWQPDAGERWSILENLDHIAISANLYLDAMQSAIHNARPGRESDIFRTAGLLSAQFVRTQEPPPRRKIPAPSKFRPRPTLQPEGVLPQFVKTMERIPVAVDGTRGKDLNAVRFPNPLVSLLRFTVATGFLTISAHARRHVWHAEQILRDPGFPQ